MTDAILTLPSIELDWNRSGDATLPFLMKVNASVNPNPKAQSIDLANSGIFTSFLSTSNSREFEIGCDSSTEDIRPLLESAWAHRDACFAVLQQLAEDLDLLHSRGMVLGFLRAETLLVNGEGKVFVPDWFLQWDTAPPSQFVAQLPQISPEYLREEPLTQATDQFHLACIAYRLLYGAYPFQAATRVEQLLRINFGIWAEASPLEEDMGICEVWDRAFSVQPAWRFPSCLAFIERLRTALSSRAVSPSTSGQVSLPAIAAATTQKKSNTFLWVAAGLLAVASVGLGAWSATLAKQVQSQVEQLGPGAGTAGLDPAQVQNGILNVCNSSAQPLQILEVTAIYRKDNSFQVFRSADHPSAEWTIAPSSRQFLSLAEKNNILWDGAAIFYYLGYRGGDNYYVSTGLWDRSGTCLDLAPPQ